MRVWNEREAMAKVTERVERVMVVARKDWRDSVNGRFLLFQFTDKEGPLKGVLWQPTEETDRQIQVNDVVRIKGEMKAYQGAYEIHVASIVKLSEKDYDAAQFVAVAPEGARDLYNETSASWPPSETAIFGSSSRAYSLMRSSSGVS